jgi:putative membrane protein
MDQMWQDLRPLTMLSTVVYSVIGLAIFGLAFLLMVKISPFSIRKEIEKDQNVALAIIMGSVFISLAIIIQAAMR